jgi:predicted aspartyl protease
VRRVCATFVQLIAAPEVVFNVKHASMPAPPALASHPPILALALLGLWPALPAMAGNDGHTPESDQALYAAPTRSDRVGRMLASVEVNGTGPYRFILDLGANRSALSSQLAGSLGLGTDGTSTVEVHGVTGPATVPLARVDELRVGSIVLVDQEMPVLTGPVFADADGILGIDGLQHARIEVDFGRDRITIEPSDRRRAPSGYLTVPARLINQGLLLVAGRVGSVRTHVVIDTGAEYTIGNLSLQEALVRTRRRNESLVATVTGATPGTMDGVTYTAPTIVIGEARLRNLPVTFSDLHVFSLWGLSSEPALIVGMDALGTVQRFVVDYARSEFQIKTFAQAGATLHKCSSANCASRLKSSPP